MERVNSVGSSASSASEILKLGHAAAAHSVRLGFRTVRQAYSTYVQKPKEKKESLWLHGVLYVTIHEADDLINPDRKTGQAPKFLRKMIEKAEDVLFDGSESSNCYVAVDLPPARIARTSVLHNTTHPKWNQQFRIHCAHLVPEVRLEVKDDKRVGAATLGSSCVLVSDLLSGQELHNWFPLFNEFGTPLKGKLRASLKFVPALEDPLYKFGAGVGPGSDVPYTYYHLQRGCRITLYQDAHVNNSFQPPIQLYNGAIYQPPRCWEEMYTAIVHAQHFVYIAGWSVYDKTKLIRDLERPIPGSKNVTLGELLKGKADSGVRVLLLVWDDRTSMSHPMLGDVTKGLMSTHDEDTHNFFWKTRVECVLCPRNGDEALSTAQAATIGTMFTHHQKTMCTDVAVIGEPLDSPNRRVISFVGGIDLCNGRYDTQQHSLFYTLDSVHKEDLHQSCFNADLAKGGPREPWHDIHCKVEGPAAWDILHNFEKRWLMQAPKVRPGLEHSLLPLQANRFIQPPHMERALQDEDPEVWMCQVLRSITSGSVLEFPSDPETVYNAGLATSKGIIIDRSMQDGWIHAIRRAQRFIYIESQYFLGSCTAWKSNNNSGCANLIPVEIALKIVTKIRAGQPFAAYVVIPMYPEGVPTANATQAILFWQARTMEMMYSMIADALKEVGRDQEQPTDYLRFFCLGNREAPVSGEFVPTKAPDANTYYARAQKNRRFMIYVHSKMLIVDDEFVIVGSANVNQRSMDGGRDTEIAAASFQPAHTWAALGAPPRGQVHGFRMSLWAEHTATLEPAFLEPWSIPCMRLMGHIARQNWVAFSGPQVVTMKGHLMEYPIVVNPEGTIASLPGFANFVDTEAPVLGTKTMLPEILTT